GYTSIMNETFESGAARSEYTTFVWRRLEPISLWGMEFPRYTWLVVLGVVLAVAIFYVAWMYIKDSRGVGPWWTTLLGLLRTSVYGLLALVFMLPARQRFVETWTEPKVVIVFDVSASMQISDELPTPADKQGSSVPARQLTRQDHVMNFLF